MAKVGEGDPRWIVKEREDATNPNEWHWTDKDIMRDVRRGLDKTFQDVVIHDAADGLYKFQGTKVVEGNCTANTRKGKRFLMYEFSATFKFNGKVPKEGGGAEDVEGVVKIPYISDENDFDDFEFKVTCNTGGGSADRALAQRVVYSACKSVLKKLIVKFMEDLTETWTKGPLRSDSQSTVQRHVLKDERSSGSSKVKAASGETAESDTASAGGQASGENRGNIEQTVTLNAPVEIVFMTFVDRDRAQQFTHSQADINATPGGEFRLFSGNVTGKFLDIQANKQIVKEWRFSDWPAGVVSRVTLTFESSFGQCKIKLRQSGIPISDLDRTKQGWNRFYWNNFRSAFGGNIGSVM
mmetsp:Transcript_33979/g.95642  ORF Transcript_33979/g.95642 Transcript_33979/m.95642 type:complete len:354 (-) Transcript_33979:751-1812(-)